MKEWNYMAIDEKWSAPWEKNDNNAAREIIENYGWDVYRLYEMMRREPADDWEEGAAEGAYRFAARLYRLVAAADASKEQEAGAKAILDTLYTDLEDAYFHPRKPGLSLTAAVLMKAVKAFHNLGPSYSMDRESARWLLIFMYPFLPHTVSELWEMQRFEEPIRSCSWRTYVTSSEHRIDLPVQLDGRVRAHIKAAAGSSEEELKAAAVKVLGLDDSEGRIRCIYIKGKMLSLVSPQE